MQIKYKDNLNYQLEETIVYQLDGIYLLRPVIFGHIRLSKCGLLTVNEGYAWDGASGAKDTKSILPASLVHDALCELINEGLIDKKFQVIADRAFKQICKDDGMGQPRLWYTHRAIMRFRQSGLKAYKSKPVLTAP